MEGLNEFKLFTERTLSLYDAVFSAAEDWQKMSIQLSKFIQADIPHDMMGISMTWKSGATQAFTRVSKQADGSLAFTLHEWQEVASKYSREEMDELVKELREVYSKAGVYSEEGFEDFCKQYRLARIARDSNGFNSWLVIPIQTNSDPIITMILCSKSPNAFHQEDMKLVKQFSPQFTLATKAIIATERLQSENAQLVNLGVSISPLRSRAELVTIISEKIRSIIAFESFYLIVYDEEMKYESVFTHNLPAEIEAQQEVQSYLKQIRPRSILPQSDSWEHWISSPQLEIEDYSAMPKSWEDAYPVFKATKAAGFKERLTIKLSCIGKPIGMLILQTRQKGTFANGSKSLLENFGNLIAIGVKNTLLLEAIELKTKETLIYANVGRRLVESKSWQDIFNAISDELNELIAFLPKSIPRKIFPGSS
jgi:GAF domain-containing protein